MRPRERHTLAALEHDVPFIDVQVHSEPTLLADRDDCWIGGRVLADVDRVSSVSPLRLFEFVLAGRAAEVAVLGDHVRDGTPKTSKSGGAGCGQPTR